MNKFYHYTTIDTLALILKFKKLRFRRLDLVDDISETEQVKYNASTHYFVSCWTMEEKENIALWKDRDSNMRGVRISTVSNPIQTEIIQSIDKLNKSFETPVLNGNNVILDQNLQKIYLYWHPNSRSETMDFYKMTYIDDQGDFLKLKSECVNENEIKQDDLVLLKKSSWRFQNEYRLIVPLQPNSDSIIYPIDPKVFFEKIIKGTCHYEYYDFKLKEEFIENIEITLGPLCNDSDKIIVESLLKNFTINGSLFESELYRTIRSK
jgi:hypothetical protein